MRQTDSDINNIINHKNSLECGAGQCVWNYLPLHIKERSNVVSFKQTTPTMLNCQCCKQAGCCLHGVHNTREMADDLIVNHVAKTSCLLYTLKQCSVSLRIKSRSVSLLLCLPRMPKALTDVCQIHFMGW